MSNWFDDFRNGLSARESKRLKTLKRDMERARKQASAGLSAQILAFKSKADLERARLEAAGAQAMARAEQDRVAAIERLEHWKRVAENLVRGK